MDTRRPRQYETILIDASTQQEVRRLRYKMDYHLGETVQIMGAVYRITASHHKIEAQGKVDCEVASFYLQKQSDAEQSFLGVTLSSDP